jgi:hypothetical protein
MKTISLLFLLLLIPFFYSFGDIKVNKNAEEWIINSLKQGNPADLRHKYVHENDRIISSKFLRSVILNQDKISKDSYPIIYIAGAIIDGDLTIKYDDIYRPILLADCRFTNKVNLSKSNMKRDFVLKDCCFDSSVSLDGIKTYGDLDISNSTFNKSFSCLNANINGNFFSDGIYKDIVAFSGTTVNGNWYFQNGTKFLKAVIMEDLKTNELFMDNFLSFGDVDLENIHTKIFRISKSTVKGNLKLSGSEITRVIFVESDTFMAVSMNHMLIGDIFQITNSMF